MRERKSGSRRLSAGSYRKASAAAREETSEESHDGTPDGQRPLHTGVADRESPEGSQKLRRGTTRADRRAETGGPQSAEHKAERYTQLLTLRAEGRSAAEIQAIMGYSSRAGVFHAMVGARKWAGLTLEAREATDEAVAQLDTMVEALAGAIMNGESRAVEVAVKVLERKAKLLGLDAPEKKLIKGQFDVEARVTEVEAVFVADVIRELGATNRLALAAHHEEPLDSAQADREASRLPTRATA